jgi:four helix bundle protein
MGMMTVIDPTYSRLGGMTNESVDLPLKAWEATQPDAITKDPLWTLNCYREALFLVDTVRNDVNEFGAPTAMTVAKEQLLTSVGSIAANISEGYGRATAADRSRFFSYALGSTREAIAWYRTVRPTHIHPGVEDRVERLSRIRRMLLGLLGRLRANGAGKFEGW